MAFFNSAGATAIRNMERVLLQSPFSHVILLLLAMLFVLPSPIGAATPVVPPPPPQTYV